jgi:hypothetical protein
LRSASTLGIFEISGLILTEMSRKVIAHLVLDLIEKALSRTLSAADPTRLRGAPRDGGNIVPSAVMRFHFEFLGAITL